MRYYESPTLERIGFDFYCDVANNIVKARREKKLTQEELSAKAKIKLSRLAGIECMKIRLDLDDLEKLSKSLDVSVDWLIDAELDSQHGECLYLIWPESIPDFKLYKKAMSKRKAFLLYDKAFKKAGVRYNSPRERFFVKLVGIPITEKEFQRRFPKRTNEDLPLEPDEGIKKNDRDNMYLIQRKESDGSDMSYRSCMDSCNYSMENNEKDTA